MADKINIVESKWCAFRHAIQFGESIQSLAIFLTLLYNPNLVYSVNRRRCIEPDAYN